MTSYVRAMYDFMGEPDSTEICINVGEVLTVTRTDVGDGWWEGRNIRGETGLFPAAYVEVLSAVEAQKYLQQKKLTNNQNINQSSIQQQQQSQQQSQQLLSSTDVYSNASTGNSNRYDHTADDDDDWEDDWDDDNDTYSEIGPAVGNTQRQLPLTHSSSNYDNKNLPATPNEDNSYLMHSNSGNINNNITTLQSTNNVSAAGTATTLKKSGMFGKSSDSYILGLNNQKDKLPDNEVVYIVQQENYYQWVPNLTVYNVIVASPKKESKFKGMKTFIAYQLTPSFNNISVFRRYKHFDWLHERLVEKFCLIPIPPLPDKQISGRYEEQFVEHRRVQLQEFVDWVCRHPVLSKCEVWHHFLTCTDDKIWKSGKRKAERDWYVGVNYCLAISPPEKQLLQSYVDLHVDSSSQFIHQMDGAVRNLFAISNDTIKRYQLNCKKEYQRIGDGLCDLAKALATDERRVSTSVSLSESFGRIGGIFISVGQLYADQPKSDWIPFSDRLHIYRGILNSFPDILSTHKGAMQKRKECERLTSEQKMTNAQLQDVNRRTDVISYAVLAEIMHFRKERDTHLKQTMKSFIDEQIKFYKNIVTKLEEAYALVD